MDNKSREESREARFIESIRDCYLYQHIEQVTRRRGNDNPSLIDLVFTDEEMQDPRHSTYCSVGQK